MTLKFKNASLVWRSLFVVIWKFYNLQQSKWYEKERVHTFDGSDFVGSYADRLHAAEECKPCNYTYLLYGFRNDILNAPKCFSTG